MSVEFKYEQTEDNVLAQLSGNLTGLKPMNKSIIVPTLEGNVLTLHIKRLDQTFFSSGNKIGQDTSREFAFKRLKKIFSETDIWIKLEEEEKTQKVIVRPSVDVEWIGDKDENLIIRMVVEAQEA